MTEIPEHLLKRSQAAKAKASGEAVPESTPSAAAPATSTPAASAPATTASAAPAKAAGRAAPPPAPAPKPDIPVVAAAKARKKIPFWAMATLSILPVWVFMYARALQPVPHVVEGPLGDGAALYGAGCSGCHGANGEGGSGYEFAEGEVMKTFPHIEDQLRWVYNGTGAYARDGVTVYGDPNREGGPHLTGARGQMPGQGTNAGGVLTDAEILAVVCHERFDLGLAGQTEGDHAEEFEKWCAPESEVYKGLEDGTYTFDNLGDIEGTFDVGTEPAPGNPADAEPPS